jgi:uncharacterized protein (DUF924 family)
MTQTDAHSIDTSEWVDEVLHFWFSELHEADWYTHDAGLDERIRRRFLTLHKRLVANQCTDINQPRPLLAAVIVLDQFSRNMFRGSARAYAADPIARRLARQAIASRYDLDMSGQQRCFLYLPFEHSEDRADQALAVELIAQLGVESWKKYAIAHQLLIDRFGRFPHRNAILGRESTAEEIIAINEPGGSF